MSPETIGEEMAWGGTQIGVVFFQGCKKLFRFGVLLGGIWGSFAGLNLSLADEVASEIEQEEAKSFFFALLTSARDFPIEESYKLRVWRAIEEASSLEDEKMTVAEFLDQCGQRESVKSLLDTDKKLVCVSSIWIKFYEDLNLVSCLKAGWGEVIEMVRQQEAQSRRSFQLENQICPVRAIK